MLDKKDQIPADRAFFEDVHKGDWLRVDWPKNVKDAGSRYCYGASGEVMYVCPKFIVLRGTQGYTFCVSKADVIEGVRLKVCGL